MDKEVLYAAVVRRLGVKRFVAKKAVDFWLRFHAEEGKFLKGAFDSEHFAKAIERASNRGNHNPQMRKRLRDAKKVVDLDQG